jgi:hypothetical protein
MVLKITKMKDFKPISLKIEKTRVKHPQRSGSINPELKIKVLKIKK